MIRAVKPVLAVMFFFAGLNPPVWSYELLNERLVFYASEEKKIEIRSERKEKIHVTIYRVDKGLDFVEREWSSRVTDELSVSSVFQAPPFETDVGLLGGYADFFLCSFDFEDLRPYGVRPVKRFDQELAAGRTKIFLPVKDDGLYLVGLRTKSESRLLVMRVTEVALFVKRDRARTVIYAQNRRTGSALAGAQIILPPGPEGRRPPKRLETDESGLFSVNNGQFSRFDRITAVVSNSIDIVDSPARGENVEDPRYAASLADRNFHFIGEDIVLTTFFFQKDEFREYHALPAAGYMLVFGGVTNRLDAAGSPVHQYRLAVPRRTPPGRYDLLTVFYGSVFTNRIDLASLSDRRTLIEVRPEKTLWFYGDTARVRITARNFGLRYPANKGLGIRVYFIGRDDHRVYKTIESRRGFTGGSARVRIPTAGLPPRDYRVRIEADFKTPDGRSIRAFGEMFVLRDTEDARIAVEKRIYLAGEDIPVKLDLKNNKDPFNPVKALLLVRDPADQDRVFQRTPVETRKNRTNIFLSIDRPGAFKIEVRYGAGGRQVRSEVVWVLPEQGDIPLSAVSAGFPEEDGVFTIVPDKDTYYYGDIAKILFVSKRKNIDALFTFEGDRLFHSQRLIFENNFQVVEMPVLEVNKPNGFLKLQSISSNRFISRSRQIMIPYTSKRVLYEIKMVPGVMEKRLLVTVENIFGRAQQAYSLVDFYGTAWPAAPQTDIFNWLYPRIRDKVIFYRYGPEEREKQHQEPGPGFIPRAPAAGTMYVPVSGSFLSFVAQSETNSLLVKDADFNGLERVLCRYRSITEDGKVGSTNFALELNGSIRRETLFPDYFHPEDRGAICVYLQNLQNNSKTVRMTVEFSSRDELLFQTNVLELAANRDKSLRYSIPPGMRSTPGFGCRIRLISQEFSAEQRNEIRMYPFPFGSSVIAGVKIRKNYTVFGRELGSAFFPRSPVCNMEDIIRVTLHVRIKKGARLEGGSTNDGIIVREVIPSGCRLHLSGSGTTDGFVEGDKICFRLSSTAGKSRLVYYLRAELPGRYAAYPALVSTGGADFLTKKKRAPIGTVTVLY